MKEEFEEEFIEDMESFNENEVIGDIEILDDDDLEETSGGARWLASYRNASTSGNTACVSLRGARLYSASVTPNGVARVSIGRGCCSVTKYKSGYKGTVTARIYMTDVNGAGRTNRWFANFVRVTFR